MKLSYKIILLVDGPIQYQVLIWLITAMKLTSRKVSNGWTDLIEKLSFSYKSLDTSVRGIKAARETLATIFQKR